MSRCQMGGEIRVGREYYWLDDSGLGIGFSKLLLYKLYISFILNE